MVQAQSVCAVVVAWACLCGVGVFVCVYKGRYVAGNNTSV